MNLAYELSYTRAVLKQLQRLDRSIARRILDYLDAVAALDDPRSRGKGLSGELHGIWRYRVGNYRVLCQINDAALIIVALDADRRSDIYT